MQALRQMGGGLIIGIISLVLVVGGIALSLAETSTPKLNTPTPLPPPTQPLELFASTATSFITIIEPTDISTYTPIPTEVIVLSSPTFCPAPVGWFQINVGANDTLYAIAERYKTTPDQLSAANCLANLNPPAGSLLYVPPVPTVTAIPCGAPFGWVKKHVVQSGDNLFRIALSYGISYPQLQQANCMGSSTTIYAGQLLWVPNVPTLTPAVPPSNTPLPTSTTDFSTPTFFPTSTPLPTGTTDYSTPTFAPTSTTAPSSTVAPAPTLTPFPTQTTSP